MKVPITDQFLWDVYKFLDKSGDVVGALFDPYPRIGKFSGLKSPVFEKYRKDRQKNNFKQLVYYLKSKGYIKIKNLDNKKGMMLTKTGISKALRASFAIEGKVKRKDGKWTMLIFDVPEKQRVSRNLLTSILHNLGYKVFQKSVWITPYDVSEKTEQLLQIHSLDEYVKIFLIEEI